MIKKKVGTYESNLGYAMVDREMIWILILVFKNLWTIFINEGDN